jgi:hypothetical protein
MLGLPTFWGCEPEAEVKEPEKELPPAVVDLPEIPADLGVSKVPERHPDGSYTIDGIRRNRKKHLDNKVLVKGTVVWIYKCAYLEEKKKLRPGQKQAKRDPDEPAPTCQPPHIQIADDPASDKNRMMVVKLDDFLEEQIDEGVLKIGDEHTFEGTYADIGLSFAAVEEGLVILDKIVGMERPDDWRPKRK